MPFHRPQTPILHFRPLLIFPFSNYFPLGLHFQFPIGSSSLTMLTFSPPFRLHQYHSCCISPTSTKSVSPLLPSSLVALRRSLERQTNRKKIGHGIRIQASSNAVSPLWDSWKPQISTTSPSFSDIFWPSAGAFAAMALLGKIDQILAPKGISMTIAPLGAVSAVLFATPSSPAARKYNMFVAQIGCAAIGVAAFSIFGPGWLARSAALAVSVAFMIYTNSPHPPAASLPLLFIDGVKFHQLNYWYALFPGAAGCLLLCLIQEVVMYLKNNFKF